MTFELRSVSRAYHGHSVFGEISLVFKPGESVAILGRSGAGKSTLLRLLAGIEPPTTGHVLLQGAIASAPQRILLPAHRRGISMVFQDLALWPNLTVLGNVLLGLSGLPLSRSERKNRALEALALCAVEGLATRRLWQVSGGEQQRVALARAVATHPTFLLLDEPFSGLDPVTKAQVVQEISGLKRKQGLTIILVTHEPLDALDLCDHCIVLEEGRIKEGGPMGDLLKAPRSMLLDVFKERLEALRRRV